MKNPILHQKYIHISWILSIIFILFISSCQNKEGNSQKQLVHTASSFSAPITSISKSKTDNVLYIGLEDGEVIKKDVFFNLQDIVLSKNRYGGIVYDIFEWKDTLLFIGVRNEGLKLVMQQNEKFKSVENAYLLKNIEIKGTNYSVYDIELDSVNNNLLLGTSFGGYILDLDAKENILQPLRPSDSNSINKVLYKNGLSYWATNSSLFVCANDSILKKLLPGKPVVNLSIKDSLLFIICPDSIFKMDLNTGDISPLISEGSKYRAYYKDELNGEWVLKHDSLIYIGEGNQINYKLPESVDEKGKQIALIDADFFRVACHNQLLSIPVHQNISGVHRNILAVCKKTGKNQKYYFITEGDLYSYNLENTQLEKIGTIKGLNINHDVIGMYASFNNTLWLATNKDLYEINIPKLTAISKYSYNNFENDFRALYYDEQDSILYLGTRYDLWSIDSKGKKKILVEKVNSFTKDIYVTDIRRIGNFIYFSTLNNGLYKYQKNEYSPVFVPGSEAEKIGNIRTLVETTENNNSQVLLLHTSQGFFKYHNNIIKKDTIQVIDIRYINSVVNNDKGDGTYFILGYYGLLDIPQWKFRDVYFKKATTIAYDNILMTGNRFGLFKYDKKKETFHAINIPAEETSSEGKFIYFFVFIFIFIIVGILGFLWKKGREQQSKRFMDKIYPLIKQRLEEQAETLEILKRNRKDKKQEIENTLQKIKNILSKWETEEDLNIQIEKISEIQSQISDLESNTKYSVETKLYSEDVLVNAEIYKLTAEELDIIYNLTTDSKKVIKLDDDQIQRKQRNIAKKLCISNKANLIVAKAFREKFME
jgi:hypothetical protein